MANPQSENTEEKCGRRRSWSASPGHGGHPGVVGCHTTLRVELTLSRRHKKGTGQRAGGMGAAVEHRLEATGCWLGMSLTTGHAAMPCSCFFAAVRTTEHQQESTAVCVARYVCSVLHCQRLLGSTWYSSTGQCTSRSRTRFFTLCSVTQPGKEKQGMSAHSARSAAEAGASDAQDEERRVLHHRDLFFWQTGTASTHLHHVTRQLLINFW